MSFTLDQNGIISALRKVELVPEIEPSSQQVFVPLKVDEVEFVVFFSVKEAFLQIVTYFPYPLNENTLTETARLLHIFNHDLDMPGFCMNENEKIIFYRVMVPAPDNEVNEPLFHSYLGAQKNVIETFHKAIFAVTSGQLKIDDVKK